MTKILLALAMAFAAAVFPARASAADRPEKLTDTQLDRVKGGVASAFLGPADGPPLMRLPVEPPTVLGNWRDRIFYLAPITNGSVLPVPAISLRSQATFTR